MLIVVAHPDDELIAAGLTYHGACAGGAVDVVTITDGQGGFKYASFAEAMTGIEPTPADTGAPPCPPSGGRSRCEGWPSWGRRLIRLGQTDHRYSQDRMEVLAADAGVWDLPDVRRRLDALLEAEGYEIVVDLAHRDDPWTPPGRGAAGGGGRGAPAPRATARPPLLSGRDGGRRRARRPPEVLDDTLWRA